jgi:hypothetical protein
MRWLESALSGAARHRAKAIGGMLRHQRQRTTKAISSANQGHARELPGVETFKPESWYVFSTAHRTARLLVLGFELADHSLGLASRAATTSSGFSSAW